MNLVLQAIRAQAVRHGNSPALHDGERALSYRQLAEAIDARSKGLASRRIAVLGLLLDNGPDWAVIDLAAQAAGITLVPLPSFFAPPQLRHAIADAGVEAILTDQLPRLVELLGIAARAEPAFSVNNTILTLVHVPRSTRRALLTGTAKVTYTSGTTGNPKGVCLTQNAIDAVAQSLRSVLSAEKLARHLSLLPLATLLENIGGLYVPLLAGGCAHLLPLARVGTQGAAGLDVEAMVIALREQQASSTILIPQMLYALVHAGARLPALRFIAVGGAPVAPGALARARELGLPVFEGYGLSECASVVTVNVPGASRLGSVGRPLPHARLRIGKDGEILVAGSVFAGYLGDDPAGGIDGYHATGDMGYLDPDGFLFLTGRKRNVFITSFGRNVAPEWVESQLTLDPRIAQAAVFGEARPFNVAVVVPRDHSQPIDADGIRSAIASANACLPDYARVRRWIVADEPFSVRNNQYTGTGRPRRDAIWSVYKKRINEIYDASPNSEVAA